MDKISSRGEDSLLPEEDLEAGDDKENNEDDEDDGIEDQFLSLWLDDECDGGGADAPNGGGSSGGEVVWRIVARTSKGFSRARLRLCSCVGGRSNNA